MGICCDAAHPALKAFPNDGVSDFQWWDLMSRCSAMVMDRYPADFRPIVHIVDDWFTNRKLGMLFEARVGKGKVLVCGVDLMHDLHLRPAAAQFREPAGVHELGQLQPRPGAEGRGPAVLISKRCHTYQSGLTYTLYIL